MKELSRDSVIALATLHFMLRHPTPPSAAEIGRITHATAGQVRRILRKLVAARLVRRDPGRGYRLAKAPGSVSVLDVVRSVDSPKTPAAPCGGDYDACDTRATCVLAPLCRTTEAAFVEALRDFSLAELAQRTVELPNCMEPRPKRISRRS